MDCEADSRNAEEPFHCTLLIRLEFLVVNLSGINRRILFGDYGSSNCSLSTVGRFAANCGSCLLQAHADQANKCPMNTASVIKTANEQLSQGFRCCVIFEPKAGMNQGQAKCGP